MACWSRAILLAAALTIARVSSSGASTPGDGPASVATAGLTVTSSPAGTGGARNGRWEIRRAGALVATFNALTPEARRGASRLRGVAVEGGNAAAPVHAVAELRVPVLGGDTEEVWIADLGAIPAHVIWSGLTGPRDVDGETALRIEVSTAGILEFQTAANVSRCDGQPVRLFARAWDFEHRRFGAAGSSVPAPSHVTATARRGDPGMPTTRPLGGFRFVSASTTAFAGDDARKLLPPRGLDDGDPRTAWMEGVGGDGRGEFLTARSSAGAYGLRGLRIVPGDASSAAAFRARNRLKSLRVAYGPGPAQSFDVVFPEDPALDPAAAREPYWVRFPEPASSTCVTITLREVYPGGARGAEPGAGVAGSAPTAAAGGTTAISELEIFTDVDSDAGLERLVADTASGNACAGRVPLLVSLGERVVPALVRAIRTAAPVGRECLVAALTAIPATRQRAAALEALAGALRGATPSEEETIAEVMSASAQAPVPSIAAILSDPAGAASDRGIAARVLGRIVDDRAAAALLDAVGAGPPEVRLATVQALGRAARATTAMVVRALAEARGSAGAAREKTGGESGTAPGDEGARRRRREADLLRVLPAVVARDRGGEASALALAQARLSLADSRDYEIEARAISALGALREPTAVEDLARARSSSTDPVLRFLAARELAGMGTEASEGALRDALGDADPRVRATAAEGLGRGLPADARAEAALIRAAKAEPWPFARRAQIDALSRTCGAPARNLMMRAIARDVDEVQRAALLGLSRCADPRIFAVLVATLKTRTANASLRELAAALMPDVAGGDEVDASSSSAVPEEPPAPAHPLGPKPSANARRVPSGEQKLARAKALAELMPSLVGEGEGDLAIEGVTVSALRALGQLGGPDAARIAADLALDARHPYRHVAVEVLGQICDPALGARALDALRRGQDPELALASKSSEAGCREREGGARVRRSF